MITYHVSARAGSAYYDLGHVQAESEEEAIAIVKRRAFVGCQTDIIFHAWPCAQYHQEAGE